MLFHAKIVTVDMPNVMRVVPLYNKWKTEYEIVKKKVRQQKELDINYVDYVLTQRSRIVRAKCGTRTRKIVAQI